MIQPTPGRIVWFHPRGAYANIAQYDDQPLPAIVTRVWGDRMVNLTVFDQNGNTHGCCSVTLVQDGDPALHEKVPYAEWMPYQKGQAAKHDASAKA